MIGWLRRHWRWTVGSAVAALFVALLAPIDYHDRDFASFWLASRMLLEGRDPYDSVVWLPALKAIAPHLEAMVPRGSGSGYPLWTAVATLPFAVLPFDAASRAWLGAQTLAALLGVGALLSVSGVIRRPSEVVLFIAMLVTAQSASMMEEVANIQGLLLGALSGALALLLGGYPFGAGLLFGLLIVKPHLVLLFIPVLIIATPERMRVVLGMLVSGGALVVASFVIRPGWLVGFMATLGLENTVVGPRATAWGAAEMVGLPGLALVIAVLALFVVWWRTGPSLSSLLAGALAMSLFVAPYAGRYDVLVLFASIGLALAVLSAAAPAARAVALILVFVAATPLPWLLHVLVLGGRPEAIGSLVPLLVFVAVVTCDSLSRTRPQLQAV